MIGKKKPSRVFSLLNRTGERWEICMYNWLLLLSIIIPFVGKLERERESRSISINSLLRVIPGPLIPTCDDEYNRAYRQSPRKNRSLDDDNKNSVRFNARSTNKNLYLFFSWRHTFGRPFVSTEIQEAQEKAGTFKWRWRCWWWW